jgi:peptidoglycan/xylan/chitin deacetylase (PgdA/CDA1 family)
MEYRTRDRLRTRSLRFLCWAVAVGAATATVSVTIWAEASWVVIALACAGGATVLAAWHPWMKDEGGVPVLVYHSVSDRSGWLPWAPDISVTVETFEAHLRMIRRAGFEVITTRELAEARRSGGKLPARALAIHLDDGYLDNWVAAVPLLRCYAVPATLFVSLDFIDPGNSLRPTIRDRGEARDGLTWEGYLNWAEIQEIQKSGLVDVQPHGIDHGRVETGPRIVGHVSPDNWRRLAWVQWRGIEGPKADWFRWPSPPVAPFGTPVRESQPALAARAWSGIGGRESAEAYEARVEDHLSRSRQALESHLGHRADIFCWPQNATSVAARDIAERIGYLATTGGRGENRPDEDPRVISRIHVGDRAAGWRSPRTEAFSLYASIRLFQGNYYWYGPLLLLAVARSVHRRVAAKGSSR